ncbi:unnamed protein product [Menidia menidia]|uniref:(Atlantic silverside) hypothetical protein n=1 Tax=Menidia menidia TaxID=238744 RepID=A0A8S4AYH0_9TELE|nr:unnamed protein product [Menidia menidia]
MGDIRQSLLPRDVLSAAKELLYHLDIYICNLVQSGRQPPQVDSKTLELVEEFILHAPKDRSAPARRMSALQELQLLEIMCSCFQEQSRDAVRQLMFSALFSLQGNQADESRMALLGKLVSMARTHRVYCVRLAQVLVDDYCSLVPGSVSTLQNIHAASPRFCCQFVTAVTTLYDLTSGIPEPPRDLSDVSVLSEELTPPPELLQMIVSWIQDDPRLVLIAFLNTPLSGSQPISSLDVTPLGGLVRWCIKAPLVYKRDKKQQAPADGSGQSEAEAGALFSALHLSVLQVFMLLPAILNEKGLFGRLALLQVDSLAALTSDLSRLLDQADKHTHVLLQLVLSGPVLYYNNIHTPPLAFSPHATHSPIASHPPLPTHAAHSPHAALAAHPASHAQYPAQPFMTGMPFPFRPSH